MAYVQGAVSITRFGIEGLPTVISLSSTGEVLTQPRVTGFLAPKDFLVERRKVK
ncbi:hypothetical protein [Myxococcus sp. NMCA1]|uniref:hypothetical protein n=1 Tax=Myxococcus sp. NMCA1 TaxID=2996785 RepID=UPI002285FF34|nr:hypothetical protein [Myxococcus sp. NMCA1]WAM28557.1 hypothetical protein OZ403_10770 [Myxococcus sp. NMCA1]